ncbi:MAG: hypothetical protein ACK2UC_14015 [Anaerolineae bacterium]|jgi:hypothetical protein
MPTTSRIYVKMSILYLALGAILGALFLINRWTPLGIWVLSLKVSHVQFLVVGWLTQLILGVAWWLFPPLQIGLRRDAPRPVRRGQAQRGSESLFWTTFICLNLGVLLRGVLEPVYVWTGIDAFQAMAGISGLFLLAAAVTFVLNMWARVRALGKG